MPFDLTELLKLPSEEKERIALTLLQHVEVDADELELSPKQEEELELALKEIEDGRVHKFTIAQLQSLLENQWKKR